MAGNSNPKRKGEDLKAAKDKKRFNPSLQQPGESSASGANRPQEGSINEGTHSIQDVLHGMSTDPVAYAERFKQMEDEKSERENKDEQHKEQSKKSWSGLLKSYSSRLKEYIRKSPTIIDWIVTLNNIQNDSNNNTSIWLNFITRFPDYFSKQKQETATTSAASKNSSSKVMAPILKCQEISTRTMKSFFNKCLKNYVTSNHDQDFECKMNRAHVQAFHNCSFKYFNFELEEDYAEMVRTSVYGIGENTFNLFFGGFKSESRVVSFKLKILAKDMKCQLHPDLNAIYYSPDTPSAENQDLLGVIVGEVKRPSIKPLLKVLKAWVDDRKTIYLEESENKKYTAILNQLLGYLIVGACRTGVITDSQLYIYLKLDPGKNGVPKLSYYTTESSDHYRAKNARISPRAAMISMIGMVLLEDFEATKIETTKMFSDLLIWFKKSYIQSYFSPETIEENFNHFKKNEEGFGGCISSKFEPIKEHIEVTVDHHEQFSFHQAEGYNSTVIEVSSEVFEVMDLNIKPKSIMAKVFDHNYVFMTHSRRTYLTLMSEMIQTYSSELEKYRMIEEYNKKNKSRPINTPKFYANGFFSLRNSGKYVPIEDTDYIATGPCILMEKLDGEELRTNEQFDKGLIQLVRLHKAGISHQDIKEANVICTKDKFFFIDYGLSVKFVFVTPPSSSQAEPSQTEQRSVNRPTDSDTDLTHFIGLWKQKVTQGCTAEDTIRQRYDDFKNILV